MKKNIFLFAIMLLLFGTLRTQTVWNTFHGSTNIDYGEEIEMDAAGNIYIAGRSFSAWGSPIHSFSGGGSDGFVAKLDNNGNLLWLTFLGGAGGDWCHAMTIDPSDGSIYVAGESNTGWSSGTIVTPYHGNIDGFVAKLTPGGNIEWVSFVGQSSTDENIFDVTFGNGNIYFTGYSRPPIAGFSSNPYIPSIGRMNVSGTLTGFDSFGIPSSTLASSPLNLGFAINVSPGGTIYIAGRSGHPWNTSYWWGSPLQDHQGSLDGFLAAFNSATVFGSGPAHGMLWYTFIGSAEMDEAFGLYSDASDNVFVSGYSQSSWGAPVNKFSWFSNGYLCKFSNTGALQWNSFVGMEAVTGYGVSNLSAGPSGNLFMSGDLNGDPSVAEFDQSTGMLNRVIVLPFVHADGTARSVIYRDGYLYTVGDTYAPWGLPIQLHTPGPGLDIFVSKISPCNLSVSGGTDEHLLFGYLPNECKLKDVTITGGAPTFNYNWILDRSTQPWETFTGDNTSTVRVCLSDTAELSLIVTDANNCRARDYTTIFAEDVRCFSGPNQKVMMCHSGKMICVNDNAVQFHLSHGDYVGNCTGPVSAQSEINIEQNLKPGFTIYPNPGNGNFVVSVNLADDNSIDRTLRIINMSGQVVKQLNIANQNKLDIKIDKSGVYLVQLLTGKNVITKKLVIVH